MNIEKKSVRSGILKLEKNVQITMDEDMNVPDTKPDVEKIVESRGEIHIDETEVLADRIRIKGTFLVQILYLSAEKTQRISAMEHEFTVEEYMNAEGAAPSDTARVTADVEDLTISIINSRKCGIRSVIFFRIYISEMKLVECSVGVENRDQVECLFSSEPMTEIVMNKKDVQRVRAEVSLPAGKANIREILWNCTRLREADVRMMDGKLSIRGELFLFLLYRGEEEKEPVQYYDWEIPFDSELDCPDSREDLIGNITVLLGNHQVTVKPDADGEPRNVEAEAVLELDLRAWRAFSQPLLKDMYSNSKKLTIKTRPMVFENLVFQNNARTKIVHRVPMKEGGGSLLQILNVEGNVRIDEFRYEEKGIRTEGLIFCTILYAAGDDGAPLVSRTEVIPFEYLVEMQDSARPGRCEIRGVLEQIGGYAVDGREIEIRAVAGIYVIGFTPVTMPMIDEIEEKRYEEEEMERIPSITAYVVKAGDTLWKIAKGCGTTIEKIRQYNENAAEPLEEGQKLFLMKEMESLIS